MVADPAVGAPDVAARRRVVEMALAMDPDVEPEALVAALGRLGYATDETTLAADLDALGYEITEDDDEVPPNPGGRGRAGGPLPPRLVWAVAGAVALVLVVVTVVLVVDDDGGSDGAEAGPTTTLPEPTEPGDPAPEGPGADPALDDDADVDLAFDEAGDTLPAVGEQVWQEDVGAWSVLDGRVVGAGPEGGADGALATVDAGVRDVRFEVALPDAYDGTGLAFSVAEGAYFVWGPAKGFPSMALYRVHDGEAAFVLHSGATELGPGLRIGVAIDGSEVELLAGGAVVATYTDHGSSTRIGLAVAPGGAFGTFDDLRVDLPDEP